MRTALIIVAVAAVAGLGYLFWQSYSQPEAMLETTQPAVETEPTGQTSEPVPQPGSDPANTSYIIEGQTVTLVNGTAEGPAAPGSATIAKTTMFGEPTMGDLNGDENIDAAVILVQSPGGGGTFYYQAAAVAGEGYYTGSNAVLLGDRIAPQSTQIADATIIANFAERAEGEPMTAQPSVGVSKYFKLTGMTLSEVANPNLPQGQM